MASASAADAPEKTRRFVAGGPLLNYQDYIEADFRKQVEDHPEYDLVDTRYLAEVRASYRFRQPPPKRPPKSSAQKEAAEARALSLQAKAGAALAEHRALQAKANAAFAEYRALQAKADTAVAAIALKKRETAEADAMKKKGEAEAEAPEPEPQPRVPVNAVPNFRGRGTSFRFR